MLPASTWGKKDKNESGVGEGDTPFEKLGFATGSPTQLGLDGRTIKKKKLREVASCFGKKRTAFHYPDLIKKRL